LSPGKAAKATGVISGDAAAQQAEARKERRLRRNFSMMGCPFSGG